MKTVSSLARSAGLAAVALATLTLAVPAQAGQQVAAKKDINCTGDWIAATTDSSKTRRCYHGTGSYVLPGREYVELIKCEVRKGHDVILRNHVQPKKYEKTHCAPYGLSLNKYKATSIEIVKPKRR